MNRASGPVHRLRLDAAYMDQCGVSPCTRPLVTDTFTGLVAAAYARRAVIGRLGAEPCRLPRMAGCLVDSRSPRSEKPDPLPLKLDLPSGHFTLDGTRGAAHPQTLCDLSEISSSEF